MILADLFFVSGCFSPTLSLSLSLSSGKFVLFMNFVSFLIADASGGSFLFCFFFFIVVPCFSFPFHECPFCWWNFKTEALCIAMEGGSLPAAVVAKMSGGRGESNVSPKQLSSRFRPVKNGASFPRHKWLPIVPNLVAQMAGFALRIEIPLRKLIRHGIWQHEQQIIRGNKQL